MVIAHLFPLGVRRVKQTSVAISYSAYCEFTAIRRIDWTWDVASKGDSILARYRRGLSSEWRSSSALCVRCLGVLEQLIRPGANLNDVAEVHDGDAGRMMYLMTDKSCVMNK